MSGLLRLSSPPFPTSTLQVCGTGWTAGGGDLLTHLAVFFPPQTIGSFPAQVSPRHTVIDGKISGSDEKEGWRCEVPLTLSPERGLFLGLLGTVSSLGLVSMAQ